MDLTRPQDHQLSRRGMLKAGGAAATALAGVSALASCSTGDTPTDTPPKGIENVEQKQLGPATPGPLYIDGYVGALATDLAKFGDGTTTFKVVVRQDAQVIGDWNKNNEMTEWFEKRTGVKVEFIQILTTASDGSTDMTKINAMLASGELPDAFMGLPFSNDQISLYGQQGIFVALDDLIETYAPNMRMMMNDYPSFSPLVKATDGKTYQFAGINDCYHCKSSPGRAWINTDYLDKVGAEMPTTTDELRAVLKLLKDNDPTPGKNIIPFASSVGDQVDSYIMNAFLYNPGGSISGGWLALNQGQVELVVTKPEWREALRFLRQLYDDKTLTREAFTMTGDTLLQAGNQGRLGFVRSYYWGSFTDIKYEPGARWKQYKALPPLKGPAGTQYSRWDYYGYKYGGLLITKDCKQPEIMVQWADAQMELESFQRDSAGDKDGNWGWSKEGTKGISGKQAMYYLKGYPPPKKTSWNSNGVAYNSNDARLGIEIDPDNPNFEAELYQAGQAYEAFAEPQEMQLPPLIFDEATAAAQADTAASIYNQVRQTIAQFSIGELDINDDKAWNDYVSSFEAMGLTNYLAAYQQAYDQRPQ